jgi:acetyl/propionyl-CoA carboxylase alpha subunit
LWKYCHRRHKSWKLNLAYPVKSFALKNSVEVKDVLIVMEAMKMKQLVPSPVAGIVKEYKVQPGDRVSAGQVIAVVE